MTTAILPQASPAVQPVPPSLYAGRECVVFQSEHGPFTPLMYLCGKTYPAFLERQPRKGRAA